MSCLDKEIHTPTHARTGVGRGLVDQYDFSGSCVPDFWFVCA